MLQKMPVSELEGIISVYMWLILSFCLFVHSSVGIQAFCSWTNIPGVNNLDEKLWGGLIVSKVSAHGEPMH